MFISFLTCVNGEEKLMVSSYCSHYCGFNIFFWIDFLFIVPAEPVSFTKIAFDNGEYELSWKPPASATDRSKIENYTIFWCNHERDRPYQCTVRLYFIWA